MQIFLTIIAFLVIFSVLVLIHEFGHFWFAKRAGIRVEEFGLGLPPRVWGVKKGETLYSINAIPFGGFVRLFGEDARDPKARKSNRSFVSKSLWQRFQVIIAGIMMNFLLSLVLLSVGFLVGIKPLIVSSEDFLKQVRAGVVVTQPGIVVKSVETDSLAGRVGVLPGDTLVSLNGVSFTEKHIPDFGKMPKGAQKLVFSRASRTYDVELDLNSQEEPGNGITFYEAVSLPRLFVMSVTPFSEAYSFGLLPSDVMLSVNDRQIYSQDDFMDVLWQSSSFKIEVLRGFQILSLSGTRYPSNVVVSHIQPGSVADSAGFHIGDVIVSVNEKPIYSIDDIFDLKNQIAGHAVNYRVMRNRSQYVVNVSVPVSGQIGLYLGSFSDLGRFGAQVFQAPVQSSVVQVNKVQFSVFEAPFQAWYELKRLTVMSFASIKDLLGSAVFSQTVPEDVGGPVRIAQMTYNFVQEGFWSVVRFAALLSMSLAVINLVPIPALDGGRLLFLVIEFVRRKPVDSRLESLMHTFGFVFLMGLILLVTYNDVLRIFFK